MWSVVLNAVERSKRGRDVTDPLAILRRISKKIEKCLKKLGHLPCSRGTLIIEVIGVMRISR